MLKKFTLGVLMTGVVTVGSAEAQAAKRIEDASHLPDDAPVQVYGQVADISSEAMSVDFGEGIVEINLRNIENKQALGRLHQGDMVTVFGHVFNPHQGAKEILADRIAFLVDQNNEQGARQTADATDAAISNAITGEVVGIFGRNLMIETGGRTVTVNTIPIARDPTGRDVTPSIEKGDTVRLRVETNPRDRLLASEVLGVRKSYSSEFEPQRTAQRRPATQGEGIRRAYNR